MWIENEPIKIQKKKNKTKSEKKTVSDAGHQIGTNDMTAQQRQKGA